MDQHLLRNNSEILKHLMGQFKSTVFCPDCDNISYKFDPFYMVQVPIPVIRKINFEFYYVSNDSWILPFKARFHVSETTTIKEMDDIIRENMDIS